MFNNTYSRLFSDESSHDFFDRKLVQASSEIMNLQSNAFEANTIEEVVEYYIKKNTISSPRLLLEQKTADVEESKIYRKIPDSYFGRDPWLGGHEIEYEGYKITITIPFSGEAELFKIMPSQYTMCNFDGHIYNNNILQIILELTQSEVDNPLSLHPKIDGEIEKYSDMLQQLEKDTASYNIKLKEQVYRAVTNRLAELNKLKAIKTALKVPMKANSSPNPLNQIVARDSRIAPLATKSNGEAGYYVAQKDYENILDVIRGMGTSMETNRAAEHQDEEGLRDILLAGLSSSIKGVSAGGELFRKSGKTDVSIMFDNKAAFVAECKLWKGKKYINEGISQLLGYVTWRDVKVSLIIFNKEAKDFSKLQKQIPTIFQSRHDYVRDESGQPDGEWRFVLQKPDDKDRHITIHVFMFDVTEKNSANP